MTALTKRKLASVSHLGHVEKRDERVVRTGQRIDAAFVELVHRKAYGSIRVSDITKKAGVGRATFYAHYKSKDELLRSQFERIVAPMLAIRRGPGCPLDATALFAHVQTSPRVYKSLTAGAEAGGAPRVLRQCFEKRAEEALVARAAMANANGLARDLSRAILRRFVATTLLAAIASWLEHGAHESPQHLQALFSKLVGEGLRGVNADTHA
jgi:AcrR family transcriptional regulator